MLRLVLVDHLLSLPFQAIERFEFGAVNDYQIGIRRLIFPHILAGAATSIEQYRYRRQNGDRL